MTWWEGVLLYGGGVALLVIDLRIARKAQALNDDARLRLAEAKGIQETILAFYGDKR